MSPHASPLVTFAIPGLALAVLGALGLMLQRYVGARDAARYGLAVAAWLASSAALGLSGVLSDHAAMPPPLVALVLPSLGLPTWLALSRVGRQLASAAPAALLVGYQAFRLPLELVMHQAAVEGTMPPQMSYTGSNFDIVSGATALVVGLLAAYGRAPRWLLLAWNALGSGLLLTIVVVAVASIPLFHAFGSEPERVNTWVAYFPFVWLPAGLVSSALFGHLVLWRRLLSHGMRGRALSALS